MSEKDYETGTVRCYGRIIRTVGLTNDVGGSSELPEGDYRVAVVRSWDDYETGARAEGRLLDAADIETARMVGTTEWTPEHYAREYPNNPALAEQCAASKAAFDPTRVFFHLSDFVADVVA